MTHKRLAFVESFLLSFGHDSRLDEQCPFLGCWRAKPQATQMLFSTDFPLADKILAQKHQQDHFYVVHSA